MPLTFQEKIFIACLISGRRRGAAHQPRYWARRPPQTGAQRLVNRNQTRWRRPCGFGDNNNSASGPCVLPSSTSRKSINPPSKRLCARSAALSLAAAASRSDSRRLWRMAVGDQRAFRVLERVQHRPLIAGKRRIGLRLGGTDARAHAAKIEGRPGNARSEREEACIGGSEIAETRRRVAHLASMVTLGNRSPVATPMRAVAAARRRLRHAHVGPAGAAAAPACRWRSRRAASARVPAATDVRPTPWVAARSARSSDRCGRNRRLQSGDGRQRRLPLRLGTEVSSSLPLPASRRVCVSFAVLCWLSALRMVSAN